MSTQEIFVARMRRQRERGGLSLDQITEATRIRRDLLEGLEQGDLSAWPRGLYARAWIRAYAEAIGVDSTEAVEEFCRLFPHGDRRAQPTMAELASIVDSPSRFRDDQALQGQLYGRRASDRLAPPPPMPFRDR